MSPKELREYVLGARHEELPPIQGKPTLWELNKRSNIRRRQCAIILLEFFERHPEIDPQTTATVGEMKTYYDPVANAAEKKRDIWPKLDGRALAEIARCHVNSHDIFNAGLKLAKEVLSGEAEELAAAMTDTVRKQ